ncbi:zinc finger protein 208-like isoform X1 [Hermetia illucens]|uniref:zinc finger protein 208-like isoform X1 n=1 Tax=Hermetia illucens TaxID=343691 RepID=UPI0018CC2699|nr:zinc finger protein 208-like isoform X1 [Hermetia illucens]
MKCGRVLISVVGGCTVVCDVCEGRFDGVESFTNHLKTSHSDYGLQSDGWGKITVKEETTCQDEIEDQGIKNRSKILRKHTAIITTDPPIYDEKRLFCITCDHQFNSREGFLHHKSYHKKRLCKQGTTHLEHDNQEDVRSEFTVENGHYIEDYEVQDSVCNPASDYMAQDDDTMETDCNNQDDSNCLSDDCPLPSSERRQLQPSTNVINSGHQLNSKHTFKDHKQIHGSKLEKRKITEELEVRPAHVKMVFSENPIFDNENNFCITCNHKFSTKAVFKTHKHKHKVKILEKQGVPRPEAKFSCELCSQRYKSNFTLRQHYVIGHGDTIPPSLKNDPTYLRCRFCHKQFEKPTERYEHEKSHATEERPFKCSICPKVFTTNLNREYHESIHKDQPSRSPESFKIHKKIHRPKVEKSESFKGLKAGHTPVRVVFTENPEFDNAENFCITCNHKFSSKGVFKAHKYTHRVKILEKQGAVRPEGRLSCELCSQRYKLNFTLRQHYVISHGDTIPPSLKDDPTYLKCRFCHEQFEKPTERHEHEKSHARDERPYKCSLCPKLFTTSTNREYHESIHSEDPSQALKNLKLREKIRRSKIEKLAAIKGLKHGPTPVKMVFSENPKFDNTKNFCITCNHKFSTKAVFKTHKYKHRVKILEKQGVPRPEGKFSCELCSQRYKSNFTLRQHYVIGHGDTIPKSLQDDPTYLKCRFCHEQFEKPTGRHEHEKSHARDERPYKCSLCPKLFTTSTNREYHESLHKEHPSHGSKKFKIDRKIERSKVESEAGKPRVKLVFSENPKFDNAKNFCITCNHRFSSKGVFKAHKYTHRMRILEKQGAVRPEGRLSCELCSQRYKLNFTLRQHYVISHGDTIPPSLKDDPTYLQCRFCHKQFERPTERHEHEKSHARDERPYKCSLCPKLFTTSTNREHHESLHIDHPSHSSKSFKIHRKILRLKAGKSKAVKGLKAGSTPVKMVFSENPKFDNAKNFCITCNHKFSTEAVFKTHKYKHRVKILEKQGFPKPEGQLSCELCCQRYKSNYTLRQHYVIGHGDTIPPSLKNDPTYLKCRFCHKQFEKPTERYEHEKSHVTEERPFKCPRCPKLFRTNFNREYHELIHRDQPCRSPESFKVHNEIHRPEVEKSETVKESEAGQTRVKVVFSENPKFDNARNFCITCNHKFSSIGVFRAHKHTHRVRILEKQGAVRPEGKLSCELCSQRYKLNFTLRQHYVISHGDTIPPSLKDDPTYLKCRFCHKQFEKPTMRHKHEKSHAREERPYKCSLCPKLFTTSTNREYHESIHKDLPSHSPESCGTDSSQTVQGTESQPQLQSNELETACQTSIPIVAVDENVCDQRGPEKSDELKIKGSSKIFEFAPEIDEESYFCTTCNLQMASKETFKFHKTSHEHQIQERNHLNKWKEKKTRIVTSNNPNFDDDKQFCITCNRGFSTIASFNTHKATHKKLIRQRQGIHPKYPTSCEFCTKQFRSIPILRLHVVKYHGDEIPTIFKDDPTYLKCQFCNIQFEKATTRYQHEKTHIKEDKPYRCSLCSKTFSTRFTRNSHQSTH